MLLNVTGQPLSRASALHPGPSHMSFHWLTNCSGHLLTTVTVHMYYCTFIRVGCFGLLCPSECQELHTQWHSVRSQRAWYLSGDSIRISNLTPCSVVASSWTAAFVQITRELFEAVEEPVQRQLLTNLVIAATDSELPEVASTAGRVVKKIILDSKLVAEKLEKMSSAQLKEQPVVSPGGMVLRSRRYSMNAAVDYCKLNWNLSCINM